MDYDTKYINLSIRHSGLELTNKESRDIFKPFFKNKDYCAGLQLFSCFAMMYNHHGKVTIDADVENGTEFLIELPLH